MSSEIASQEYFILWLLKKKITFRAKNQYASLIHTKKPRR